MTRISVIIEADPMKPRLEEIIPSGDSRPCPEQQGGLIGAYEGGGVVDTATVVGNGVVVVVVVVVVVLLPKAGTASKKTNTKAST